MKMLAFLAGEFTNAAHYFTTFANVNKHDSNDVSKSFNMEGNSDWQPFRFEKRVSDAKLVSKNEIELSKRKIKHVTMRSNLTSYISNKLKSRQEVKQLLALTLTMHALNHYI